jgi:hypothetical protein
MLSPNFDADVARLAKLPKTRRHEIYATIGLRESARLRPIIPNRKALSRFVKGILASLVAAVAELDAAKLLARRQRRLDKERARVERQRRAVSNIVRFPVERRRVA